MRSDAGSHRVCCSGNRSARGGHHRDRHLPRQHKILADLATKTEDAYERYKTQLGKGLLLGLEFLIAADVVRTVVLEPSLQNVMILGLLVVIRKFLSWSLVVEIEGAWPWRRTKSME
jgi:uncharacterized membrane protein